MDIVFQTDALQLLLNPNSFRARFRKTAGSILRELREYGRSPEDSPGDTRIYTAGEKSYENEIQAIKQGVRIPPSVQQYLNTLCAELHITHDLGF